MSSFFKHMLIKLQNVDKIDIRVYFSQIIFKKDNANTNVVRTGYFKFNHFHVYLF